MSTGGIPLWTSLKSIMSMNILDVELSFKERAEILYELFLFTYDDEEILLDDDGEEFYAIEDNQQWNFTTLRGVIKYAKHVGFQDGIAVQQRQIRIALGL